MVKRVCLVSSGTGGHLMPAVVLARALRERGLDALLVTEGRPVEREFLARDRPGDLEEVDLEQRSSRLGLPVWLLKATARARRILRERGIDLVVGTGGRTAIPVGLAARSMGLPLFLLEQNAVTGRANRMLLPLARRMYLGLPHCRRTRGHRMLLTGTPLRPEFYGLDREKMRAALGLRPEGPVVLVTGGSQGARVLNRVVPEALGRLGRPLQVLHLTGLGADEEVRRAYHAAADRDLQAQVRPVAMDMYRMLGAADLVLCRGGGSTVAELMAAGRPAVVVPYPHHRDRQQSRNADVLARAGAGVVVEERDLGAAGLAELVGDLLDRPQELETMGRRARQLALADPCGAILSDLDKEVGLR